MTEEEIVEASVVQLCSAKAICSTRASSVLQAIRRASFFPRRSETAGARAELSAVAERRVATTRSPKSTAAPRAQGYSVSDIELASRLSYFLWASMPDDELLRAADGQTLRKPGVLETQVKRMLADARSRALVDDFAAQWLQLRDLDRKRPAPERFFPALDDELLDAMRRETQLFVEAVFREGPAVSSTFSTRRSLILNGPLARHYGIAGVDGEEFRRVTLDGEQRSGILTQGAILTVSSYPTRTSFPVIRGKWVLENLLGTPLPPPPDSVPEELEEAGFRCFLHP